MRKRIDENEEFAVAILFKFFGVLASKNVYLFGLILLKVNTETPHGSCSLNKISRFLFLFLYSI